MIRRLALLALVVATPAHADELTLAGNVRVRYEMLDGQPRAGLADEDEQLAIRSILGARYQTGPVTIGAELHDSRAYLTGPGGSITANDVNAFELVQAWIAADLGDVLGKGSTTRLQAGRFTLSIGSRRFIADDDYRNTTNGFTGIRADLRARDGTSAVLFYTLPQTRLPDDRERLLDNEVAFDRESFDLQLWGGLVATPRLIRGATAEIGYIRLEDADSPTRPTRGRDLHTITARVIRDVRPGRLDFEIEAAYQLGTIRAGLASAVTTLDVSASFVHFELGYAFAHSWKPRVALEYERTSGDGPGGGFGRFDSLFGSRRSDLGPSGIYGAVGRANLSSPAIRFEAAPSARLDGFAVYRALWAAEKTDAFSTTSVRDASGRSGSFAGHQIEGRLRWWVAPKRLRAELNGAYLIKRGLLRTAPNAPATGDTRYISIAMTAFF